jgi:transposase
VASASDNPNNTSESIEGLRSVIEARDAEVALLKLMIRKLQLQLARRNRALFGASSERFEDAQGSLIEPALLDEIAAPKPAGKTVQPAANIEIDRSLPAPLPREEQVHRPDTTAAHHDSDGRGCGCNACGGRLRRIGADVSEQLEYVPSRFKVIRHVRPKLACVKCQSIFQADAPSRPIVRGLPGPGLMAHVMVSKYCDHLPLYRQSRIYARERVEIDRSTLARWVARGDELLEPLLAALGRYVLAAEKVHADDTPVNVLDPGAGKTKTGRLWVYVRDDRPAGNPAPAAAWYRYSPDRKGEHPQDHLKRFRGILQADAYGGWTQLYDGGVVEAACWAHARRPWWDLYQSTGQAPDSLAAQALRRIKELYKIEAEIRGQSPNVRREQRKARAGPLLDDMYAWLVSLLGRVSAKSELAQAIGYSLTRWTALTRYVEDGRIEIDNSAAERALRGVALGRNNFLFMGSDAGGERAAAMYSLVETAKLNGLDPQAYLREVFDRIAEHPINRIEELLPWNITARPEVQKLAA